MRTHPSDSAGAVQASSGETKGPLSEKALLVARLLWCVLVVLTLVIFGVGLPSYGAYLHTLCLTDACAGGDQLTPSGLRQLHAWGFSLHAYVSFALARILVFAGAYLLISLVLIWRRSNEWMVLLTAFSLIAFATLGFNTPLITALPIGWHWLAKTLLFLGDIGFTLFFYLFPDGRFVPRWTRWTAIGGIVLWGTVTFVAGPLPPPATFVLIVGFVSVVMSLVIAQMYRYRFRSSPAQRHQTQWVVYGITVAILGSLTLIVLFGILFPLEPFSQIVAFTGIYLFLLAIPISIGIATLRYRLWDSTILINRTLLYGTLTASILGIYALVVGYFGLAFQVYGNPIVDILATGLAAVLFQPLRTRLQRAVNRLTYGDRDDPYGVITRLGQRLEATLASDEVLPTIVETVAQALKLPYVAIMVKHDRTVHVAAAYGESRELLERLPLTYQSEPVGDLLLAPRSVGEHLTPADRQLLAVLTRQVGIAVHAVQLTAALHQMTRDLQHSREHLVIAREEERRRLRRDLHDGLGPTLAHLTLQLDGVSDLIPRDAAAAQAQVTQVKGHVQEAIHDIRRLVDALRPPILDEFGLLTALREQAALYATNGFTLRLDVPPSLPVLSAAVEVATYRIVLEALTNVVRHAHAHTCVIHLTVAEALVVDILDDGIGLPARLIEGIGLPSMRERAEEVGGRWSIQARREGGTHIHVELPLAKR